MTNLICFAVKDLNTGLFLPYVTRGRSATALKWSKEPRLFPTKVGAAKALYWWKKKNPVEGDALTIRIIEYKSVPITASDDN